MRELKEKEKSAKLNNKILVLINSDSKADKEAGFELLFKVYKPMVFNFLNRGLYFDEETAKDLMIDVFTKVHLKIDSYSSDKSALSTWIHRVTKNTLLDHIKSQVNRETLSIDCFVEKSSNKSDDDNTPKFQIEDKNSSNDSSELLIREERLNALLNALGKMQREDYKQALTLFYLEQKSYAEISEQMNLPLGSVKAFLHRAKSSLKNILIKQGFKG